ncbi:ribosomal RNA methyltransferase [Bacillus methanolicus PB1]|uniref:Ribosomal RNA methyltransferase n=1 Tax=Bacillus methanolicus PB1 TaxID=997296 RepID=I3E0K7_BACMT|nr:class I SAM-dependent methyltransferase [Bacillus methanolicus]EIJ80028.1 ribosomal RNA methyltransferase [Bacillus methanolicus PB1]
MSDHYYSRTQNVVSDPVYWDYKLRNNIFRFKTDNGVFSKREIDFGSRLLIETFALPDVEGNVLDVGCGYGPIGLSIAKSFETISVHMVDVNDRALALAKENALLNKIDNVLIYESDRLTGVKEHDFASIVTNPPIRAGKKIVHDIFEQSVSHLKPGGELWVVIQKKQGAPSAIDKLNEIFDEVGIVEKKKGYFVIRAKKY